MIDIHNHLQDSRFAKSLDAIIVAMREAGVTKCVTNGTSPKDWRQVADLAKKYPDFIIPAFGLHPWKIGERPDDWLKTLRSYLNEHPQAHIGECGLDRWIKTPDISAQKSVFKAHLELAHELKRPIAIHCLKAWAPLLEVLEDLPLPPRALLHSYSGSIEFARQLCQNHDPWFSFSGYFLQPKKSKTLEIFRQLPPDRVLIETDAPDMLPPPPAISHPLDGALNHPANLAHIAKKFLETSDLGIDLAQLNDNTDCFLRNV